MTISEFNKVDAIGQDNSNDNVVLTIFDHLDWSDHQEHLEALQNKLNSYLEFVESGQVFEDYPASRSSPVQIQIVAKFEAPDIAHRFIARAAVAAEQLAITIVHRVHRT